MAIRKYCLLLALLSYSLVQGQSKNLILQDLTAALNTIASRGDIKGFSVALVNSDSTVYSKGIGFADVQQQGEYTAQTIQTIGSISKTTIGIAGCNGQGTLLNKESFQELFKPNLGDVIHEDKNDSKYNDEYEMGIFMGISAKGQIGHTGGNPGVASFMFFDVEKQTGKLLVVNTDLTKEGVKSFIDIWKTLETYETKL